MGAVRRTLGLLSSLAGGLLRRHPKNAPPLAPGDSAPEFSLEGSDGRRHTLADSRGRFVVLAWFPKAFTAG
jgi:hypothetical protein